MSRHLLRTTVALLAALSAVAPRPASAQPALKSEVFASGFHQPLGLVADPTNRDVLYVLEKTGRVRVVVKGVPQLTDFLDMTLLISPAGEGGLLGMAFAPDYATSRRVYVSFNDKQGHSVIARFKRDPNNARRALPESRFDLRWSNGFRFIAQPFSNHNGGNIAFGPDGFLYFGLGDGGGGDEPNHGQQPGELLGKFLRIDVNVPDDHPDGFVVPASNPFLGRAGYRPEIWSFGFRNPWRWSFDDVRLGGTGALIIGDVGQGLLEEIDYEPAGAGGRNYGWRNKEGTVDNIFGFPLTPPAFLPLTDPVHQYGRGDGQSVTGGFVYRGRMLGTPYRGRYFFADFVASRVWSVVLHTDGSGAAGLIDHTEQLGGAAHLANISSFGVDLDGELYIVSFSAGRVLRVRSTVPAAPTNLRIIK
jgi:glucose/arabinose dehydrogenase